MSVGARLLRHVRDPAHRRKDAMVFGHVQELSGQLHSFQQARIHIEIVIAEPLRLRGVLMDPGNADHVQPSFTVVVDRVRLPLNFGGIAAR